MDANGWVLIIGAIGVIVTQVVAMILTHLRASQLSVKVDENTALTKQGSSQAASHAAVAASAAASAKVATETLAKDLSKKLNGDLDIRISQAVADGTKKMFEALEEHIKQDEENMVEIRNMFAKKDK